MVTVIQEMIFLYYIIDQITQGAVSKKDERDLPQYWCSFVRWAMINITDLNVYKAYGQETWYIVPILNFHDSKVGTLVIDNMDLNKNQLKSVCWVPIMWCNKVNLAGGSF